MMLGKCSKDLTPFSQFNPSISQYFNCAVRNLTFPSFFILYLHRDMFCSRALYIVAPVVFCDAHIPYERLLVSQLLHFRSSSLETAQEKQPKMVQVFGAFSPIWEMQMRLLASSFSLVQCWPLWPSIDSKSLPPHHVYVCVLIFCYIFYCNSFK